MNDDEELGRLIRDHASRYRATPTLQASVRAEIALESAASPKAPRLLRWRWPRLAMAGLGFALGAAMAVAVGLLVGVLDRNGGVESELVASHVRALMVAHLTDVTSTDQHTVKPWFQGRLDYSPPVRDLEAQGFPLVGGRLDYVSGRAVAALVYRRREHVINVFVWPGSGAEEPAFTSRQGFNMARWHAGGMQYWAVSDVNTGDLRALQALLP